MSDKKAASTLSAILAVKQGMCRIFDGATEVPCTVINVPENVVVGIKTPDNDGYAAVKIAIAGRKKIKPLQGELKKAGIDGVKVIKEVKGSFAYKAGDRIAAADFFKKGSNVTITGVSKGKGFASVRKRWHFKGGPKTHGQKDKYNSPGSIGASSYPSRVFPGMKMAGHMGNCRVTVKNLLVAEVDADKSRVYIRGAVPGIPGEILIVRNT